jgi:hypothetical protein
VLAKSGLSKKRMGRWRIARAAGIRIVWREPAAPVAGQ